MLALAGRDSFYYFWLENGTDQTINVAIGPYFKTDLGPCSAKLERSFFPPPGSDRRLKVTVKDHPGNVLSDSWQTLAYGGHGTLYYELLAPSRKPGPCPTMVRNQFRLTISNTTQSVIQIWLHGKPLGSLAPGEKQTFGPITARWRDVIEFEVRDAERDEVRPGTFSYGIDEGEFDLGQVPEMRGSVEPGWLTRTATPTPVRR